MKDRHPLSVGRTERTAHASIRRLPVDFVQSWATVSSTPFDTANAPFEGTDNKTSAAVITTMAGATAEPADPCEYES